MNSLVAETARVTAPTSRRAPPGAPYPEQLILDWTDYCNAKCFFCYREKYEQQIGGRGEFIPFEKLRKLENVLSQVKVFGISSAIGEPLLHPELEDILRWLYAINPSIKLRTVTNGTALTGAKAAWFAGHLDWLSVSLNAANGEAHFRDMFPHLAVRGIDAEKRWELHLRHLSEFIAALPSADRPRVRFQMVAHRHNVDDIADFVRVVHSVGASHAVIANIAAHSETVDWSLFWIKDRYNAAVDEARAVGSQLGVQVDAARFYTSAKPVLDLDVVCRDPVDIAYISRASVGAPCCNWVEAGIPTDVYSDTEGFDRYWSHDILRRLRKKRNFESCRVCGMSRVFDETSFHFSPKLKQDLIADGRLSEITGGNDYPDIKLVRVCLDNELDLPNIRHTLLALNLPAEIAAQIETQGLGALPALDEACWEAFRKADVPVNKEAIALSTPILGIGWGPPIHEPQNRISARSLGGAKVASLFVRVTPGTKYELRFTIHQLQPIELEGLLQLHVNGQSIKTHVMADSIGRNVVSGFVPDGFVEAHDGRLWIGLSCREPSGTIPGARISLMHFEIANSTRTYNIEEILIAKDALIRQQRSRLAEQQQYILALQSSRSWRVTAPLRRLTASLRRYKRAVAAYHRLRNALRR
jgi:MoaA/NifB/PqqE/SkfB family radical SAM enzyme